MLVIFPFEEDLYRDQGVDCVYVGNPLLDEVAGYTRTEQRPEELVVGLLPGSRSQEIERIAPVMAEVGTALQQAYPLLRLLTPCLTPDRAEQIRRAMGGLPVEILTGGMHDVLTRARCCLVASGTATLETALFEVPMCIVYRLNPITYWLAKLLVHIRFIGIVNILAGRMLVPELIQQEAVAEKILPVMKDLVEDTDARRRMVRDLRELKQRLGPPGASARAAAEILKVLGSR